ncbi:MAG: sulfite exporter TauE/SafE family protein [Armatimonadetes bacterium]|nr:sulfite exporter TauE/SafE family protein [Armatimonadota bacterium]
MHLTTLDWLLGIVAALLVGFSKTGVPGVGILVVPLMAGIFGGRLSVGAVLPMLSFADCFAVARYRSHTRWDKLLELVPWVVLGMLGGAGFLLYLGERTKTRDVLSIVIGYMVLGMLGLHLARKRWGDRLTPHSRAGVVSTGALAGFSTTVSNAAGPIMTIYLTGMGLGKNQFMGTTALYFFIFNLAKVPIFLLLTHLQPGQPIMTHQTLMFDLAVAPAIAAGALSGSWLLPRIPQKQFDSAVLILAGLAALKLII